MWPDQVYLIVNEFELSYSLFICLEITEVSDMPVARFRPSMCLAIWIIVCRKAHAPVARVSQVPQLVNVEGMFLIRSQPVQSPRYHCLCRPILGRPSLREADVALGVVLRGMRLHEAHCGLREGTQVVGCEEDLVSVVMHAIQVRLMQVGRMS